MSAPRGEFKSRLGFILAAAGSAVGLGHIWGFPTQAASNGGAAFSTGVTNNGASSGTIRFEVPMDAPNSLYYQCTSHSGMGGTITVYPDAVV